MVQYLSETEAADYVDEMISPWRGRRVRTERDQDMVRHGTVIKSFMVHSKGNSPHPFVMVKDFDGRFFITRSDNILRDD